LLRYFGRTEEDFPDGVVGQYVAILEDNLESCLAAKWPSWVTAWRSVEAAAGIDLSKNSAAYRTTTLEAEGDAPEELRQVLAKAVGE
jgi:hypothetical protein